MSTDPRPNRIWFQQPFRMALGCLLVSGLAPDLGSDFTGVVSVAWSAVTPQAEDAPPEKPVPEKPEPEASTAEQPEDSTVPPTSPEAESPPPSEPPRLDSPGPDSPRPDSPRPERPTADETEELTEDDLVEKIDPNRRPPMAEARERLEQAIEKMRSAKDRLTQSDTGDDTRKLQNQAADELQKILDLLQQPPPPSQNQNQQNQNQQQQNQQQNQQQRRNQSRSRSQQQQQRQQRQSGSRRQRQQNRNRQLAQQQPQPAQQQPGERSENPQDSQDKLDPAQQKAAEEARRRAVANDVWGHLPPNVREALQKSFNERYLPKYEELVRRYYESLAEKQRD